MRRLFLLPIAFMLANCSDKEPEAQADQSSANIDNAMAADAAGFDSPTLPPTTNGQLINVSSDPGVTYHLLESAKMPNGNLEIMTRRDGSSGTSFARREVDCGAMTFRYLGEGDSLTVAKRDSPSIGEMSEAMSTSISGEVAQFACGQS